MRRGATQPDTHWAQQGTLAHLSLFCLSPFFPWSRRPSPPWAGAEGASPAASSGTPRRGLRPAAPPASSGTQLSPAGQSALKAHLLTALQSGPQSPSRRRSATPSPSSPPCCRRRREWTSSPSPSPPATPPQFVLPIRHPNLPTSAGHGACRSDAAPAPRPLLAGPRQPLRAPCRSAPPATLQADWSPGPWRPAPPAACLEADAP
ncbi:hypothetical protein PVAP13_1KG431910 [Panicum virgatum]|uniref:Uncharacterized protein n=1 Tax=Panicum virgatum TaxID=38727 RepID=A0A8T0XKC4_PANVG|nr:hypothetical protein PVAP13_1KG431910 [Panicum virgatum]